LTQPKIKLLAHAGSPPEKTHARVRQSLSTTTTTGCPFSSPGFYNTEHEQEYSGILRITPGMNLELEDEDVRIALGDMRSGAQQKPEGNNAGAPFFLFLPTLVFKWNNTT
jgi:hypothetical protein